MEACAHYEHKRFFATMEKFDEIINKLQSSDAEKMAMGALEEMIEQEGRELMRLMLEEHIAERGTGKIGRAIEGSDGFERRRICERSIRVNTIFGKITLEKAVYGAIGHNGLAPKEAMLNLSKNSYSHLLSKRISLEAAKGSFDEAIVTIKEQTGVTIPKRQAREVIVNAAMDFEAFYMQRGMSGITRK